MTKFRARPTVEVMWEGDDSRSSSYPRRSTVEIPSFIMEDYRGGGSAQSITDYLRNAHGFQQFEWEWINGDKQCP